MFMYVLCMHAVLNLFCVVCLKYLDYKVMDKEWTKFPRFSQEYINGVTQFLDFSYTNGRPQGDEILCPCAKCKNLYWKTRDNIKDHLIAKGFLKGYDVWLHHGE